MKIYSFMIALLAAGCLNATPDGTKTDDNALDEARTHADAPTPPPSGQLVCGAQSCALPGQQCCYTGVASSTGTCTAYGSSCSYGTEQCDGPEDCAAGQKCFVHDAYSEDPWTGEESLTWLSSCRTTPIDPSLLGDGRPRDKIACHPGAGTCPSGRNCVPVYSANGYELPRELYVCY